MFTINKEYSFSKEYSKINKLLNELQSREKLNLFLKEEYLTNDTSKKSKIDKKIKSNVEKILWKF
jgi:hypothetical protein